MGQALFGELGRQDSLGMLTRLRSDLADTLILLRGASPPRLFKASGGRMPASFLQEKSLLQKVKS